MRTFGSFENDGYRALTALVATSEWGTVEQALASLAVFASPETVDALSAQPIFRIIRGSPRRHIDRETRVMFDQDNNHGPIVAFEWATGFSGPRAYLQFNHIYQASRDVQYFTNLANICVTPNFLGKFTDREGATLLRYRAWKLFRLRSPEGTVPTEPAGYEKLKWADPLPPLADVEGTMRRIMSSKPKDGATCSVYELGWIFSDFVPDLTVHTDTHRGGGSVRSVASRNLKPARENTIEHLCVELLERNLPYEVILRQVRDKFPLSKTTRKSLDWYKNKKKKLDEIARSVSAP